MVKARESKDDALPSLDEDLDLTVLLGFEEAERGGTDAYGIGELAREFGVTQRTLRFYEDRGILHPQRRGKTRLYSRRDHYHLRLALLAKLLGLSLMEAQQVIRLYGHSADKRHQIEQTIALLERQKPDLLAQKTEVENALVAIDRSIDMLGARLRDLA